MYFSLPFVHCILKGNYTIEPVEPLDYNPSFYQPMRETVTNRKPFEFATHGNLSGGKTTLKESHQNIRQFKNSQK